MGDLAWSAEELVGKLGIYRFGGIISSRGKVLFEAEEKTGLVRGCRLSLLLVDCGVSSVV